MLPAKGGRLSARRLRRRASQWRRLLRRLRRLPRKEMRQFHAKLWIDGHPLPYPSLIGLIHSLLKDCLLVILATFIPYENLIAFHGVFHWSIDGQIKLRPIIEDVGVASTVNGVCVAIPHFLGLDRNAKNFDSRDFAFLPCKGMRFR